MFKAIWVIFKPRLRLACRWQADLEPCYTILVNHRRFWYGTSILIQVLVLISNVRHHCIIFVKTRLVTWGQPAFLFVMFQCRVIITRPKCVVNVPCHWMRKTYLPNHFVPMMFHLASVLLLIRWKACAITPQPVTVIHDFGWKRHTRIRMGKWRHAINLSLRCHWFLTFITWSVAQADHQSLMFLQRDDFPRNVGGFFTELILSLDGSLFQATDFSFLAGERNLHNIVLLWWFPVNIWRGTWENLRENVEWYHLAWR